MERRISPAQGIRGALRLPGDKSISHRYGMLSALAEGQSKLNHYSSGADCHSTLGCMAALGAKITKHPDYILVEGRGLEGLTEPTADLDAGNSGSTIRMLSGILAAQPFRSRIFGDESLSRRPMARIMKPLAEMGARIHARDGQFPPLEIDGTELHAIDYTLPVASAQVKSSVLFAGLFCDGVTIVREPIRTRDHSEIALRDFGAEIEFGGKTIKLTGRPRLQGRELNVPGDLSSAAFFLVAALLMKNAELTIQGVGLNPTRAALLDFLSSLGARIQVLNLDSSSGELIGDLKVTSANLQGGLLEGALTAALIDEIPVLAVLGAARGGLRVRDAGELRVKETDRIATIADNLKRLGCHLLVTADGFDVPGGQTFHAAELDSFGDHRIAMAFAVASLIATGPCTIHNADAASVSYPEFYDHLQSILE